MTIAAIGTASPDDYPNMRYGMDHTRYEWSMLQSRPNVTWPGSKPLAVWVNVSLEHFALNPKGSPLKLPGAMTMPYPDLRHFSLRDYGNRVGIYRFLKAFDAFGIQPSFAINAELAARYPFLLDAICQRGDEVIGHSWSMDTPHAGAMPLEVERELIERSLAMLRTLTGQRIRGWLSPGKLQTPNTPELLKEGGIDYSCDWVNDELPYRFHTQLGDMWSLPLCTEIEDRFVVMDNLHGEASWAQQVIDAFDYLLEEAKTSGAGRLLSLSLHPWVMGQPHRIKHLERVLDHIAKSSDVWQASPSRILDAFTAQQPTANKSA